MHFSWELSFGQIVVSVPIVWILIMLMRLYSMMLRFRIEHEDLMLDWCAKQNPPRNLMDLPTRRTRWW